MIPECLSPNANASPKVEIFSLRNFILSLMGSRFESRKSKYRIKIAPTAGYIANTDLKKTCNPTQSGTFAAFWIKSDIVETMQLEDEYWLDDTAYALPDDQVFFYKGYIKGVGVYHSRDIVIRHLDHGSSNPNRRENFAFASGRNFLIFWHRFLYTHQKLLLKRIAYTLCIVYRIAMNAIFYIATCIKHRTSRPLKAYINGVISGYRYISGESYKKLTKL